MDSVRVPKVALITGSGRRRVGSAVAEYLARAGYNIALHYHRSADSANELADSIRRSGVDCHAFQADVASEADVEQMFEAVVANFGRLDVLVTTASVWDAGKLEAITVEDVMRSYSVNAVGTFLCARRAGLLMVEQSEGGAIVTIGDWAIQRPYLDHVAYFMAKGSVEALTRSLAVELAHRNPKVRVNCVHPGPVMFPPNISKQEREMLIESTLVKSGDCPESIGRAVLFLAEDEFVTGVCLPVDGGRTIFASESTSRKRPI